MLTAHNITVNNGVFNQYIAGEQRGEITIKFSIRLEFTERLRDTLVSETIDNEKVEDHGARYPSTQHQPQHLFCKWNNGLLA